MSIRPLQLIKWLTVFFLLGVLLWGAYYVYDKGFGKRWRGLLTKEFHRFGLEISVRRLTLDPFRGLVAKDLEIYDSDQQQTILARISDLSLDINYGNLIQQEPALNTVDLRDTTISIPLDPLHSKAGRIRITGLHSRIYFLPGRIEVRQASGDAYGIHLNVSGTLVNPGAFKFVALPDVDGDSNKDLQETFVEQLVREIQALHFSGETPQLDCTFQVDLADPASWRLQGCRLRADKFDRHGYSLHNLVVDFSFENQRLALRRFFVQDSRSELFGTGEWNVATGEKRFQVRSSLNLAELIRDDSRFPWTGGWKFDDPPEIEISGIWQPKKGSKVIGKLNFGRFSVLNIPFQSLTAEFSRAGDSWMVSNGEVTHRSGTLSGEVLHVPGDFRVRIDSGLNPTELTSLFPTRVQAALAGWEFMTSPVIQATVTGRAPVLADLSGSGQIWLGKTKLHGSLMNSAAANFRIKNQAIQYDQVRVIRDEGVGTGGFTYDFVKDQVNIQNAEANLYPAALASWIHPSIGKIVQPFRFTLPPAIHVDGTIQFKNGSTNDLRVQISTSNQFIYQYAGLQIPFDAGAGECWVHPDRIEVNRFDGRIGDGTWSMHLQIGLPLSKRDYHSTIFLKGINTQKLTGNLGAFHGYQGKVSGELQVHQTGQDTTGIFASGNLTLRQAVLNKARLFAPLLSQLEPSGFRKPLDVKMNFRFQPESVKFDSLQLQSGQHSLRLNGSLLFLNGLVDLAGDYKPGAIPVRGTGTTQNPIWQIGTGQF
jgi:hypothetical protein